MKKHTSYIFTAVFFSILISTVSVASVKHMSGSNGDIDSVGLMESISAADEILPIEANSEYVLNSDMDLKGKTYTLPEGVTIKGAGGLFRNGTLVGNRTKVTASSAVFDNVRIQGSWNVPEISTDLFADLDYDNSLRDVFMLADSSVENKIVVKPGVYNVRASSNKAAINVAGNTTVYLEGEIRLRANKHQAYSVMQVKDAVNVLIKGAGKIIGDKDIHTGEEGEWGHGVNILNSSNVRIYGITVENCWGDCIYVGKKSEDVVIADCSLSRGRRQGISVTCADGVLICDCIISEISGTMPQHGIDIEPNKGEMVDNVTISNVKVFNSYGGIMTWAPKSAWIGRVSIKNCHVDKVKVSSPMSFLRTESVTIQNCSISSNSNNCISAKELGKLVVKGNVLKCKGKQPVITSDVKESEIGG